MSMAIYWDQINFLKELLNKDFDEARLMIKDKYPAVKMIINEIEGSAECHLNNSADPVDDGLKHINFRSTSNKVFMVECITHRAKFGINAGGIYTL